MGNFSRDPEQRLADAEMKHYVGHRVQQGVPLLDADLHLIDGLRRREVENLGQWVLGNGVPVGSDGFRVAALASGGMNTIVLRSATTGTALSTLAVDLGASTAAAALGFDATNASASRLGDSPAQLTGRTAEPFALAAGSTLTVVADGGAPEMVTFKAADFANIAAATANEVAAALNAGLARAIASAGTGRDFYIAGGDGTTSGAGRLLVDGRMLLIERGLRYSEQPLYQNAALAARWGVPPVVPIPTPTITEAQIVFVDSWDREVGSQEDPASVDARIGIETAVSLRREWAVRVVPSAQYAAALAARPAGHAYYPLAELRRAANDPRVTAAMIVDRRDTDASLRREVAYRNTSGAVTVDTARFEAMLVVTRDNVRDLIAYLTTKFVQPSDPYLAGEIAGIDSLSFVSAVADHAITSVRAQTLGTRGALDAMRQLYEAERRFVAIWKTAVLPLVKGGNTAYKTTFGLMLQLIEQFLDGPAPGGHVAIKDALDTANLDGAVTSQERIAAELGDQSTKPFGALSVKYLGSVTPTIQAGVSFDLRYEITGTLTPADDIVVTPFIDPQWAVMLKNQDGSTPFALRVGPGAVNRQFLVGITPPAAGSAQSLISLLVSSKRNPGVNFLTAQKQLTVGNGVPPSEDQFALNIFTASVPASNGVYQVNAGQKAILAFRFENNTNSAITVDLLPSTSANWQITALTLPFTNRQIPAQQHRDFEWEFTAPAAPNDTLIFTLTVAQTGNNATVFATTIVKLHSV